MHKKLLLALPLLVPIFLSSCKDNDPAEPQLEVPATYDFSRNGATSVDYSGQVQRQNMLREIATEIAKATNGATISETKLISMYENTNAPFTDATLNQATSKKLSDKTSASAAHVAHQGTTINWFKQILKDAAAINGATPAQKGIAGTISTAPAGTAKYLVSAKGVEYSQLFQKALMGACFMDQAVNNYLSSAKLINNDQVETGKNYTTMEHSWDEAYGYFTKNNDFVAATDKGFWGGYFNGIENVNQAGSKTYLAFRTGRAAIVAKDYETRDKQVEIIKQNFEAVCVNKALHYLDEGKTKINAGSTQFASAFHALSEGLGFIYSLQYASSGKVSAAKAHQWMDTLTAGDGFWANDILTRISTVKTELATLYQLDPTKEY
jgi:hypothetical protein